MIKSFLDKGLRELFEIGRSSRVRADLAERCRERLLVIHAAKSLNDLAVPGFDTHPLKQFKPWRYSIKVSGAWRITFEWSGADAMRVDLEQYH